MPAPCRRPLAGQVDDDLVGLRADDDLAPGAAVLAGPAGDRGDGLGLGGGERALHRDRAALEGDRARALERARERAAGEVDEAADLPEGAGLAAVLAQHLVAGDR